MKLQINQEFVGNVSWVQQLQDEPEVPHVSDGHLDLGFSFGVFHGDELGKSCNVEDKVYNRMMDRKEIFDRNCWISITLSLT